MTNSELSALTKALFKYSFLIQFRDQIFFSSSINSQNLLLLLGTSTSGKSSISGGIRKKHSAIVELDFDVAFQKTLINMLRCRYAVEFDALYEHYGSQVMDVIFSESSRNGSELTTLEAYSINTLRQYALANVKKISHCVRSSIADHAARLVKLHYFVICHAAGFNGLGYYSKLTPFIVLVYCPLAQLISRVNKRNSRAVSECNYTEKRPVAMVRSQYNSLFKKPSKLKEVSGLSLLVDTSLISSVNASKLILMKY